MSQHSCNGERQRQRQEEHKFQQMRTNKFEAKRIPVGKTPTGIESRCQIRAKPNTTTDWLEASKVLVKWHV